LIVSSIAMYATCGSASVWARVAFIFSISSAGVGNFPAVSVVA
jgi:hypothetical protein